jgi:hypothetical protein
MNTELTQQTEQFVKALTLVHNDLMNLTFTLYILTCFVAAILLILLFKRFK